MDKFHPEQSCTVCNSRQIENEEHFLLHCTHYNQGRQNLMNIINKLSPGSNKFSSTYKINDLLKNKSTTILRTSSKHILNFFETRDIGLQLLSHCKLKEICTV